MKVKAITSYHDLQLKKDIQVEHEFSVDDERGQELIDANVAVEVLDIKQADEQKEPAKEAEEAPTDKKETEGEPADEQKEPANKAEEGSTEKLEKSSKKNK